MKELPILYSTEMVQAVLEGRKTQTRRVITPNNTLGFEVKKSLLDFSAIYPNGSLGVKVLKADDQTLWRGHCKWQKDNLLWVRETWKPVGWSEDGSDWNIKYRAGGTNRITPHMFDDGTGQKELDFWIKLSDELDDASCPQDEDTYLYQDVGDYLRWKPSIHMPKKAARIWLRVEDVRCEALHDISEEDAKAEGVKSTAEITPDGSDYTGLYATEWFSRLWDSINKSRGYGWNKNPWVWVVKFELISTNGRPE